MWSFLRCSRSCDDSLWSPEHRADMHRRCHGYTLIQFHEPSGSGPWTYGQCTCACHTGQRELVAEDNAIAWQLGKESGGIDRERRQVVQREMSAMTSIEIRANVACYLRFARGMPLVCFECDDQDVIAVTKSRQEIWVEVKASLGDLRADCRKRFHRRMREHKGISIPDPHRWLPEWPKYMPQRFYFAMAQPLCDQAAKIIAEHYPWAGLLSVVRPSSRARLWGHTTSVAVDAEQIHTLRVSVDRVHNLVVAQSASLANLAAHYARARREPHKLAAIPNSTRRRLAHLGVDETEFRKVVEREAEP